MSDVFYTIRFMSRVSLRVAFPFATCFSLKCGFFRAEFDWVRFSVTNLNDRQTHERKSRRKRITETHGVAGGWYVWWNVPTPCRIFSSSPFVQTLLYDYIRSNFTGSIRSGRVSAQSGGLAWKKRGKNTKKNGETKRNGFLNNDFPSKAVLCALGP